MKKRFLPLILGVFFLIYPVLYAWAETGATSPEHLLSDADMTNTQSMTREEIQAFLSRGYLGSYQTKDARGVTRSATDIILNAATEFQLNPQVILVTLQKEQSLVEDPSPSQNQLDWAMGYAICDDCSKADSRLQKYKGFGNQVYQASKHFREAYLAKLETQGVTVSGYGPGIEAIIDGTALVPENNATAALYTYTPHLHGNFNFMNIWNRWFTKNFPSGTLIQSRISGAVWLVQNGKKRPILSKAALSSRFNSSLIVPTDEKTIESYPVGAPINFPNYSLLRSPSGSIYLLVDDVRRGFTSLQAFHDAGFMDDDVVDASWDDLSTFTEGTPITSSSASLKGSLMQDARTGGVFYVDGDIKQPIISREILQARFVREPISLVRSDRLSSYRTGQPISFPDGTLVGVKGSAEVFVIDQGKRRPIADEATFLTYGWKWNQIYWTTERAVLLQPLGNVLTNKLSESNSIEIATHL